MWGKKYPLKNTATEQEALASVTAKVAFTRHTKVTTTAGRHSSSSRLKLKSILPLKNCEPNQFVSNWYWAKVQISICPIE